MMTYKNELQRRINAQWDELSENMGLATSGRNKEVRDKFKEAAIQNVDNLFGYHQVDLTDEVLEPYIKVLKKRSGSAVQTAINSKTLRFISNLFLSLPAGFRFSTGQSKHIIKRVEGNYSGDVELPERSVELVCRMVTSGKGVEAILASLDTGYTVQEFVMGERMMYTLEIANSARVEEKRLGYVIVTTETEHEVVKIETFMNISLTGSHYLTAKSIEAEAAEYLAGRVGESRTAWEVKIEHHKI